MINLVVFSDLHIAHKMIDQEVIDNLIKDIKTLVKDNSIICFCGDLMHRKVEFNDKYAQQAVLLLKEIDNLNVPVIVIEGTYSHDYQYIDTIKKVGFKNFTFIQHTQEIEIQNKLGEKLKALCIPEEYVEDQFEYYKDNVYNKKKKYDLVLMHGTFSDILFHNVSLESETLRKAPKFESSDFSRHLLTLSGHVHKHQILGKKKNVIYVGSYSNMNFGQDKSNNILSIDLDLENKTFDMKVIENKSSFKFEELEIDDKDIEDFENKFLKMFKNKPERTLYKVYMKSDDILVTNMLKELKKDGYIRSLVIEKVEKQKQLEKEEKANNIDYNSVYVGKIEDQIQLYIKNTYNIDMNKEKILNYIN